MNACWWYTLLVVHPVAILFFLLVIETWFWSGNKRSSPRKMTHGWSKSIIAILFFLPSDWSRSGHITQLWPIRHLLTISGKYFSSEKINIHQEKSHPPSFLFFLVLLSSYDLLFRTLLPKELVIEAAILWWGEILPIQWEMQRGRMGEAWVLHDIFEL